MRRPPNHRYLLLALALWLGCGGDDPTPPAGKVCALNTECSSPLICTAGRCHKACAESRDCPFSQLCVKTKAGNVCQLPEETRCYYRTQCAPLVCAIDGRCRNECLGDLDCVRGQICTGSKVCAELGELALNRNLVDNISNLPGDGGPPSSDAGGDGGAPPDGPSADAPAPTDGGGPVDGPATDGNVGDAAVVCTPGCALGNQCVAGQCQPCGSKGQACCGSTCSPNLSCTEAKLCACGGPGQVCCAGTMCDDGTACAQVGQAMMCSCGGGGQSCCPGNKCNGGLLACGGGKCGCVTTCSGQLVRLTNGTVWNGATAVTTKDGGAFKAEQISHAFYGGNGYHGCGLQSDGSVWCWGVDSAGQVGTGDAESSQFPLPAVTGPGVGSPRLEGIKSVTTGPGNSCAVGDLGKLWCWGGGQLGKLGNGDQADAAFAIPVPAGPGGPQLADVKRVSIGVNHVCAVKNDGTLYCWGNNGVGQLGIDGPAQTFRYPQQVKALLSSVSDVVAADEVSCAVLANGEVRCWGSNRYGLLGNGLSSGTAIVPGKVLESPGGAPFTDAVSVEILWGRMCVTRKDRSVWCWGSIPDRHGSGPLVPTLATDVDGRPLTDVSVLGPGCVVRTDGTVWVGASTSVDLQKVTALPSCL